MAKQPAFQFYPADWLKDTELQMCSMSTQGIWINLLCRMWQQKERGKISGTKQQFMRLIGCSESEFETFLSENEQQGFATVEICNGRCNATVTEKSVTKTGQNNDFETPCNEIVTVINRRMYNEDKERKSSYDRVLRHRSKKRQEETEGCNAKVTPPSSTSSSTSVKENNNTKENITFAFAAGTFGNIKSEDIRAWQDAYPAVDVHLSVKQAAQWLVSNPTKSKKNYRRFLTNWFARTQEKGGNKHAPKSNPNHRPNFSEQDWGQELIPTGKNEM
jgi:hypothetical protein